MYVKFYKPFFVNFITCKTIKYKNHNNLMQKKKISGKFYRQVSDIHIYIDLEFIASSPPQGLHNSYLHLGTRCTQALRVFATSFKFNEDIATNNMQNVYLKNNTRLNDLARNETRDREKKTQTEIQN